MSSESLQFHLELNLPVSVTTSDSSLHVDTNSGLCNPSWSSSKTAHREYSWSHTTCAGPEGKGPGSNRHTNASLECKLPWRRKPYMECTHCLIHFWAVGTTGCMLERVHRLRRSGLVPSTKQTTPVSDFIPRVWMNMPLECPKNLLYESHLTRFWGNRE